MCQHPTRSDATPEGGIGGRRSWGYCAMATMDGQVPLKKNVWDVTLDNKNWVCPKIRLYNAVITIHKMMKHCNFG